MTMLHIPVSAEPAAPAASKSASSAGAMFRRRAKSFAAASRLLSAEQADRGARLYEFCRYVDDVADDLPPGQAVIELEQVLEDLHRGVSRNPVVCRFLRLAQECGIDLAHAVILVRSLRRDVTPRPIRTHAELVRYGYGVAGTVGLMMCPVVGVRERAAEPFAIDLGIAMQITNIVRDIREDAGRGRVYLPNAGAKPFTPAELREASANGDSRVTAAMLTALDLADRYYESAALGYAFLPSAARAAIAVAGRLYREIGNQARRDPLAALKRRTVVSSGRKLLLAGDVLRDLTASALRAGPDHEACLHAPLFGLPGASSDNGSDDSVNSVIGQA